MNYKEELFAESNLILRMTGACLYVIVLCVISSTVTVSIFRSRGGRSRYSPSPPSLSNPGLPRSPRSPRKSTMSPPTPTRDECRSLSPTNRGGSHCLTAVLQLLLFSGSCLSYVNLFNKRTTPIYHILVDMYIILQLDMHTAI